ncbi:CpsD/CapB family tyrosine-protein kinase [Haloimpatiens massiliensis]|uniref:CpsD/CapB family tyrosine-protein kinase n=1 Tax=Haloimpatiens massiliensis TaxID=1658110 RepID=UPI000C82B47B|nr:CpsD/CapB family tyrosine-protein kinase [Haloimpatiens massiliensis]
MLVIEKSPKSVPAEAYRTLRTNIQYASFDKELRRILVTSSGPGEGKSTTAANLALSIAETGKSVLLIDCDLRKPSIHKKFKISNEKGVTNFLLGEVTFEQATKVYKNKLFIMTAGTIPPNPAEMLSSNKLKNFLKKVSDQFDMVIIDSPPVMAVTDAQILSTITDGVILVITSAQTEKAMAIKAKESLKKVNANILGVVLNRIKEENGKSYGYYYYYNEDENGEVKKKKRKKE